MMLEMAVLAPVICQPSLPLDQAGGIAMSTEDLIAVKQRLHRDKLTVLAYRFEGDRFCKAERFAAYSAALGERSVARMLPDSAAKREGLAPFFQQVVASPHSVVTAHLIDEAGQPTVAARDEILPFFAMRLGAQPS